MKERRSDMDHHGASGSDMDTVSDTRMARLGHLKDVQRQARKAQVAIAAAQQELDMLQLVGSGFAAAEASIAMDIESAGRKITRAHDMLVDRYGELYVWSDTAFDERSLSREELQ